MQKTSSVFHVLSTKIIPWGLFTATSLPLLVLAYLGMFTRYLADDYSIAVALSKFGFWQAQVFWYQNWLGKFTHTFLVSLMGLAGVPIVPWLPALSLLAWGISLFWALRQILRTLNLSISHIWVGVLVNIIVFGTIKSLREYQQVVFWQSGISDYMSSVILSTLLAGIFIKRLFLSNNRPLAIWEGALWFLAIFVSGGCSETWSAIQVTLFGLGLFSAFIWGKTTLKKNALRFLFIGFLAAAAAFIVIAKAPGNINRDTVMAELSFDLFRYAIMYAFWDVNRFLGEWVSNNTLLVLLLLMAGLCAGLSRLRVEKASNYLRLGLILLIGAYILLWAGFAPRFAVMGDRPPDRTIFTPMFLFIWMFVLFALLLGDFLQNHFRLFLHPYLRAIVQIGLILLIVWLPVRATFSYAQMAPSLRLYAQLWDQRDLFLRQQSMQGVKDVIVPSLRRNPALRDIQATFWLEGDLHEVPESWINQVAADYYGLSSITGRK
jgi:hypothetical protein